MRTEQNELPQTAKGCFFMCQNEKTLLQPLFYCTPASPFLDEETKGKQCVQSQEVCKLHRWSLASGPESRKPSVPRVGDTEQVTRGQGTGDEGARRHTTPRVTWAGPRSGPGYARCTCALRSSPDTGAQGPGQLTGLLLLRVSPSRFSIPQHAL